MRLAPVHTILFSQTRCMSSRTTVANENPFLFSSVFMMKAKAEAEAKEMQAKGLKRGEDFVDCKCLILFIMPGRAWPVARTALGQIGRLQGFRPPCVRPAACVPVLASRPSPPSRPAPDDLV